MNQKPRWKENQIEDQIGPPHLTYYALKYQTCFSNYYLRIR